MIYLALFGVGRICLLAWRTGILLLGLSAMCAAFIYRGLSGPEWNERKLEGIGIIDSGGL